MPSRFNPLPPADVAAELMHAVHAIHAATKTLDWIAKHASHEMAARLNAVEGQGDLGMVARRLSELAADIEMEADDTPARPALLWNEART